MTRRAATDVAHSQPHHISSGIANDFDTLDRPLEINGYIRARRACKKSRVSPYSFFFLARGKSRKNFLCAVVSNIEALLLKAWHNFHRCGNYAQAGAFVSAPLTFETKVYNTYRYIHESADSLHREREENKKKKRTALRGGEFFIRRVYKKESAASLCADTVRLVSLSAIVSFLGFHLVFRAE